MNDNVSYYKKCLNCGCFTDEDEKKCRCGQNSFEEPAIAFLTLFFLIKKGEVVPQGIFTKNPEKFCEALQGSPS